VPNPDDERFEGYLKRFQPLAPDALPSGDVGRSRRRYFSYIWAVSGTIALVIIGMISLRTTHLPAEGELKAPDPIQALQPVPGFTIREANALLATAPSYKAAMDGLAFHPQRSNVPNDKLSALNVLGKEKTKL
jgi:hypothetical protein